MDVRVFSKSDFDVNTWINDSLSQEGGGVDSAPDKTASTLVMKLQLLIAKLNGNLEEESGFLIGSLPRVLREAESLGQETQLLKSKMQAVQKEMEETKEEELIHLDTLKDRIQILRNAVQEADNWSVLTQDIQSLLSSETPLSLEFIDKFTSLQNSLKILAHVPDYGDRLKQLEGLKNQMEARVSPLLIQAFNNDDFENAKFFHSMFIVMERGNQLNPVVQLKTGQLFRKSFLSTKLLGELLLCMEELEVTLTLHFIEHAKKFLSKDSTESQKALDQHDLYLLDHDGRQKLEKFYFLVKQGKSYPILNDSIQLVTGMLEDLQSATFKILFHSIQEELNIIPSLPIWKVNQYGPKEVDLPDCSFSPQEYITKIGQYLMTLPQHLEPYMSDDNIALSRSLQECLFPYSGSISPNDVPPVDFILGCIATATCECYMEEILKISSLPKKCDQATFYRHWLFT
ncbi:COG7 [Lepeophtheirus salmonis]|uniref:Conserved oligomeric Golgi complex subunit 7 n=1 Tax=Lepeophtheirus salmonis TaxID=72036 RepID=A0A7R8D069_LEPSM|nr:COG7 [Lepeophtheirus salmonis]CAF2956651.1 COG7 [Lepeophtheirus salmonis]